MAKITGMAKLNITDKYMNAKSITIDEEEVAKFTAMADEWWNPEGKFKPLHKFNPVRIEYITNKVEAYFKAPIANLEILDIGCGGGLISEPLAKLGAKVTAIDASEKNIKIASSHAKKSGITIDYQNISVEDLVDHGKQYDIILNLEVLEHVADVEAFIKASAQLLKPDGIMFLATLNRTVKSYGLAIIGAEYILQWLPKGTHDWKRFLKPSEVERELRKCNIKVKYLSGLTFSPLRDEWHISDDIDVNYIMVAEKEIQSP